jgi:hypothetical protein
MAAHFTDSAISSKMLNLKRLNRKMFTLQGIKLLCWIYGVVCILIKQPTVCVLTAVRRLLWQELTFGKSQPVGLLLTGLSVNIKIHRFAWLYSNIVFLWSTVVEKLLFRLLVKKLAFYGTQTFIVEFTTAYCSSPSWAAQIQSMLSQLLYLRYVYYYPVIYALVFQVSPFAQFLTPGLWMHLSFPLNVPCAPSVLFS